MVLNENEYKQYVDGDFDTHIMNQRHTDGRVESWATEAEIQAAAHRYSCEICVLKTDVHSTEKLVFGPASLGHVKHKVFLRLRNEHFDVLVLKLREMHTNQQRRSEQILDDEIVDWFEMSGFRSGPCISTTQTFDRNSCFPGNSLITQKKHVTRKTSQELNKRSDSGSLRKDEKRCKDTLEKRNKNAANDTIVTNLSSRKLSENEMSLLCKGQSFVPTRKKIDVHKLHSDLAEWERRMRLAEFFHDKETRNTDEDGFKLKRESRFTPEPGRDKWLDAYIEAVKNDIINGLNNNIKTNLNKKEHEALRSLLNDTSIVIRPADKGSGLVVTDSKSYIDGLQREMEDSESYKTTDGTEQEKAEKKVKQLANKMYKEGVITKDLKEYLIPKYAVRGKLKGNPKIHKVNNPYRTIVSGIGTATENMAEVAEKELNSFVEESPSFIKDTSDFLLKIEEVNLPLPRDAIVFCFDVVKLYPSIPRKEGMEACERALNERKLASLPTEKVLDMINVVLDNNIFEFAGKEYTQTEGVAIGSRLGRNFACSYMRTWDERLFEHKKLPDFYKRYIDDGFGIWAHGVEELMRFKDHANNIHQNIKVELRWSTSEIEFLDTWIRLRQGYIETDLYCKPSDKHQYVLASSAHPTSVKKGIPYGLGIRLKRICSSDDDYKKHREELKIQLRKRGYSGKFIESQLSRVDMMKRKDLFKQKENQSVERVPLVLTYTKQLPKIHDIVRKHETILHRSQKMKEVFKQVPIVAYRRDRNLSDLLIHGKTNRVLNTHLEPENIKCKKECVVCSMLDRGIHCKEAVGGIKVTKRQECKAHNLVYGVYCNKCKKMVYVGETSRTLKERMKEHEADVRLNRDKAMSHHFNGDGHTISDIGVSVLEAIKDNSRYYRLVRELNWIRTFQTEYPEGLNTKTQIEGVIGSCL